MKKLGPAAHTQINSHFAITFGSFGGGNGLGFTGSGSIVAEVTGAANGFTESLGSISLMVLHFLMPDASGAFSKTPKAAGVLGTFNFYALHMEHGGRLGDLLKFPFTKIMI